MAPFQLAVSQCPARPRTVRSGVDLLKRRPMSTKPYDLDAPAPAAKPTAPRSSPPAVDRLSLAVPIVVTLHLVAVVLTGTAAAEHWIIDGATLLAWLAVPRLRPTLAMLMPIWAVGVLYRDIMPAALALRGSIHVADLYHAELACFGIETAAGRVIPCELFRERHWPAVDLLLGLPYAFHHAVGTLLAICLTVYHRNRAAVFLTGYLLVHAVGFSLYVIYPAAPPWYVELYGLGPARLDAVPNAAGLGRVDDILGIHVVRGLYAKSTNIFGAMPSLHSGLFALFPLVTWGLGLRWFIPATAVAAGIWFGAVYFQHHYVLDVLAGIALGAACTWAAYWWHRRSESRGDVGTAPAKAETSP